MWTHLNLHKKRYLFDDVCLAGCNFSLTSDRWPGPRPRPHQIRFSSSVHLILLPLFKPIQDWIAQIISVYFIDR